MDLGEVICVVLVVEVDDEVADEFAVGDGLRVVCINTLDKFIDEAVLHHLVVAKHINQRLDVDGVLGAEQQVLCSHDVTFE